MSSTDLAIVDMDAAAKPRALVPLAVVRDVSESLAARPRAKLADLPRDRASLLTRLVRGGEGDDLRQDEAEVFLSAVRRLPPAAPDDSFVWNAAKTASDVHRLVSATVAYRRFNASAMAVSEAIGGNEDFRKFVRAYSGDGLTGLAQALEDARRHNDRITSFACLVSGFADDAAGLFASTEWTIASALVVTAAADGFRCMAEVFDAGWRLPSVPSAALLDAVAAFRGAMADHARVIRDRFGVDLMRYSPTTLSGLRRAVSGQAADLSAALSHLGIVADDPEELSLIAREAKGIADGLSAMEAALAEDGFGVSAADGVLAHALARRLLMRAADVVGVRWRDVADNLALASVVGGDDLRDFVTALDRDAFSAKLDAVSRDRSQALGDIVDAAERYVALREYWIAAGQRVIAVDPGIRMADVRSVLDLEPEVRASTEALSEIRAVGRKSVAELEDHLEWLIAVYGLPAPSDAIGEIITSRGAVLHELLSRSCETPPPNSPPLHGEQA